MIADRRWRCKRRERTLLQLLRGIWLVGVSIALQVDMGEAKRPFLTEDTDTVPVGSFELEVASTLGFDGSNRQLLFPVWGLKAGVADRVDVGLEGGYQFVRIEGSMKPASRIHCLKRKCGSTTARRLSPRSALPSA